MKDQRTEQLHFPLFDTAENVFNKSNFIIFKSNLQFIIMTYIIYMVLYLHSIEEHLLMQVLFCISSNIYLATTYLIILLKWGIHVEFYVNCTLRAHFWN